MAWNKKKVTDVPTVKTIAPTVEIVEKDERILKIERNLKKLADITGVTLE